VSPRSEEFIASARERLGAARAALDAGFASAAVSAAYYAGLARGALRMQEIREGGDDDARSISTDEARAVLTDADAFVAAIESLLAG